MSKEKISEEKLQQIFSYNTDMFKGLSLAERSTSKTEIAKEFWAKWRNDPDILSLLEEVAKFVKICASKYARNN